MRVGSLFSGYGGLDLSLRELAVDHTIAWVADNAPGPGRILARRFPGVPNLYDVTRVDWTDVEPVDLLTGGTPCQDLSHAGRREGMRPGTRSNLWVAMREAIAILRPGLVLWENVRGALNAHADSAMELDPRHMGDRTGGPYLRALGRVLGDLADLGYDAQWHGVRASDVGGPHERLRIFLLGHPRDPDRPRLEGRFVYPERPDERTPRPTGLEPPRPLTYLPTPEAKLAASGPDYARATRPGSGGDDLTTTIARLLPTPAVNDMGGNKTVEWWDDWAPRQLAADGTSAPHGRSLAIEAIKIETDPEVWGQYADAIARWEEILDRPAPPARREGRLTPEFVEWMMGLPTGWVTSPGLQLTRAEQLRILGNGVVPRQAAHALTVLAARIADDERSHV